MAKLGAPHGYTKKIGDEILFRMSEGESLRKICKDDHMPNRSSVHKWVIDGGKHDASKDLKSFSNQYPQAQMMQAFHMVDEMEEIADDDERDWEAVKDSDGNVIGVKVDGEHVQRSKLRIDTRKWMAAKMLPKVFGDKTAIVGGSQDDEPVKVQSEISRSDARRVALMMAKALKPDDA